MCGQEPREPQVPVAAQLRENDAKIKQIQDNANIQLQNDKLTAEEKLKIEQDTAAAISKLKEKREANPSKFEGNWEKESQEELEKREMRRDLREFLFTNYFLNDKNFYVHYFSFVADYNHPKHNKILGEKRFKGKELVEEMKKLGYEKKRKRINGIRLS